METIENKEKAPIIIAPATGTDAEGISEASYETWLATYPNEEAGISREDIEEQMKNRRSSEEIEKTRAKILENNPNRRMWVAHENGKVVGFASLSKEPEFNQLKSIYILPGYQGKGIGQKLWTEVLNEIGDDRKKIIVHVATYNTQAIEFYKKLGFKETGKEFSDERFRMKSGAVIPETELVIERKTLVPHSPEWAVKFNNERELIKSTLGDAVLDIQHIGSTAFPDIMAKPIVDIIAAVPSLGEAASLVPLLEKIGYEYKPDMSSTERLFFRKGDPVEFHLSLAQPDHTPFWERQLLIRDFLLAHPEYAKEYEQIKMDALKNVPEADRSDLSRSKDYNAPKSAFIDKIIALAKAEK